AAVQATQTAQAAAAQPTATTERGSGQKATPEPTDTPTKTPVPTPKPPTKTPVPPTEPPTEPPPPITRTPHSNIEGSVQGRISGEPGTLLVRLAVVIEVQIPAAARAYAATHSARVGAAPPPRGAGVPRVWWDYRAGVKGTTDP
ncbi:MAG: hypothetical protein M3Z04_17325, partial [Chloroflexota bacterium]|nr:hypothetical protein [Chloroflexota bacterium]